MKRKSEKPASVQLSDRLVGETLAEIRSRLAAFTEQPLLEALLILSFATRLPKTWVLAHPASVLTAPQAQTVDELMKQRCEGQALPYLIGKWEFYGLEFRISPNVLIPRPETEILVDTALEWLRTHPRRRKALDVGSGSGCIGISLAVNVNRLLVIAGDISHQAVQITRENAIRLDVEGRVLCYRGDLSTPLSGTFDLICANLPYIPTSTLQDLAVADSEPGLALDGGSDGLVHIRRLLEDAPRISAPGGLILLEIEASQGKEASEIAKLVFPEGEIAILPDLAGIDRVVCIQVPE